MNKLEQKIRDKEATVDGYKLEDLMLSDFMVWLYNTYIQPEIRISIFHIENEGSFGGEYGAMQGAISKGKGKRKGVLDVCSVYEGILSWMEFKLPKIGKFSNEQLTFIGLQVGWDRDVFIIRNFDFFKFVVENILLQGVYLGGGIFTTIEQVKIKHCDIRINKNKIS